MFCSEDTLFSQHLLYNVCGNSQTLYHFSVARGSENLEALLENRYTFHERLLEVAVGHQEKQKHLQSHTQQAYHGVLSSEGYKGGQAIFLLLFPVLVLDIQNI